MTKCPHCPHKMLQHDGDGMNEAFECLSIGCECYYYEDV